jgi:hypothetical protein
MTALSPPFGATARAMGLAWYRSEDYQRIREISDDEMQPTFEAFEEKMRMWLPKIEAELPQHSSSLAISSRQRNIEIICSILHGRLEMPKSQ